jgi:hypothetical protein
LKIHKRQCASLNPTQKFIFFSFNFKRNNLFIIERQRSFPMPSLEIQSLNLPGFLPDGSEFQTWEPERFKFSKTYYVDQSHPNASDDNPGTKELPFRTINRAAQVLQPRERVVVGEGVYREWVCPVHGETG